MAEKKKQTDETAAADVVADAATDEAEVTAEAETAPVEEAAAEAPAEETAEAAAPEAPAAEVVADETAADETAAEETAADETAEPAQAAEPTDAPAAAAAAVEVDGPALPAPQSGPKVKKKRVPRSLRPQKTRPKRAKATERKPIVRLEKPEHERGRSQERLGTVVSAAMDKTVVVKVEVIKSHRKYKKVVRRSVKFHAHDEANAAKVGDVVRIVETRPLSATKRWRLTEIVEVAK